METQALQGLSGSLYLTTITVVGIRLLLLARTNRALPELYVGASLLLAGTLGASLEAYAMTEYQTLAPEVAGRLMAGGKALSVAGILAQGLFIRLVFRPTEPWAVCIVVLATGIAAAAMGGFAAAGTFATGVIPESLFLFELVGRCAGSVWLAIEAGLYYRKMRLRQRLGLADPVVTNRFLLWVGAAVSGLGMLATSVPPVFFRTSTHPLLAFDLLAFAVFGALASGFYMLAFFPPSAYRAWLVRGASAVDPSEGGGEGGA